MAFGTDTMRLRKPVSYLDSFSYWLHNVHERAVVCRSDAKEELRLQVGNFRQDLRTLATSKGSKSERKAALAAAKDVIVAAESLDYAIRSKDPKEADKLYAALKTKLSAFTSAVVA